MTRLPKDPLNVATVDKTIHQTIDIDGVELFYRRRGRRDRPAVLLLHGFPSSSYTFRTLMPALADAADLVAPDLPGSGLTETPDTYDFSFETMSRTIERFVDALEIDRFFVYLHDFGAAVGYPIALRNPERVLGLIVQNGNAHPEGLGPGWDTSKAYWADPSEENRARLPEWFNFAGTRDQYIGGVPDRLRPLFAPESWLLDWERMSRPGNIETQFRIYSDYKTHVDRFDEIAAYHIERQPPCLLIWGRHDNFFALDEILAYARELDDLEMHVLDGAHMLLETHAEECAALMRRFLRRVAGARSSSTGMQD